MAKIHYAGTDYSVHSGASVLETLEGAGVEIPNACRSGVCQSCLMQARAGHVPPVAQAGLKDTLKAQNYFLACQCRPESDLDVVLAGEVAMGETSVRLAGVEMLNSSVMRVRVAPESTFPHRSGQFINLVREDGLRRSYSLAGCASAPGDTLELHVRHIPGGAMSDWLRSHAVVGESMRIQGPHGSCFYMPGNPDQPILLIGTGTGLAPLYGIVCDALASGHSGPIHLYHGARSKADLYLVDELHALAERYPNLEYLPCVIEGEVGRACAVGRVDDIGFGAHPALKGWRSYFCGSPELVNRMRKRAYLAGAGLSDIYVDAFLPAGGAIA
ncbi:hypothetical protein BJI67_10260 [Acidihalobacter aeolianus]|uniref:Oxygenase n=1 Tax=Acidihalobacter aeolianus TaxID=2792603 RepID=A0A1D8K8T3_9GAMM|nr:2Fe-2S iron-sulfur cluster-binding protein [Acidihalobacter aeolianus]AOV17389.1 hypothetical protein BJI67_10260 [Acidihalobacter aeolianus]